MTSSASLSTCSQSLCGAGGHAPAVLLAAQALGMHARRLQLSAVDALDPKPYRRSKQAACPSCRQRQTLHLTPVACPGHVSAIGESPVCCRFAAGRGMGPTFEQLFTCAVEALHDPELPVSPACMAYGTELEVLGMAFMGTQVSDGLAHVQCPGPSGLRPMPCTFVHAALQGAGWQGDSQHGWPCHSRW